MGWKKSFQHNRFAFTMAGNRTFKGNAIGWVMSLAIFSVMALLPGSSDARALSSSDITLSSQTIGQGELCLIQVRVGEGEVPHVTWRGKEVYLVPNGPKTLWSGFLSADLKARKGDFEVAVTVGPHGEATDMGVEIAEKSYGVRSERLERIPAHRNHDHVQSPKLALVGLERGELVS